MCHLLHENKTTPAHECPWKFPWHCTVKAHLTHHMHPVLVVSALPLNDSDGVAGALRTHAINRTTSGSPAPSLLHLALSSVQLQHRDPLVLDLLPCRILSLWWEPHQVVPTPTPSCPCCSDVDTVLQHHEKAQEQNGQTRPVIISPWIRHN